nr:hypothetical protein [Tanacetum cinerariifolium]
IVNGYFGMPMNPLDQYVQLVMEAPPSSDYVPGPEASPSPDYIPGPEAPPSPDYIPGPKYPEYLPPADDMFPIEEPLLPAAISPITESPGYIADSEPEMDPKEEDGDDEKSEGDSIEGDDDADDDGDDLSEDDADDKDKEESSDKPFEEGETVATPPPFRYRVAARISVRPHIPMPFRSEASMVLMRSAAPSTFILAPRSRTPPIGTPSLLPIPLPTTSFPLPLLLLSTSGSESIPKADMPLQKRARFTTPTGGYEVGESSGSIEGVL